MRLYYRRCGNWFFGIGNVRFIRLAPVLRFGPWAIGLQHDTALLRHVRIWLHQRHAIRNLITARVYDERSDRKRAIHHVLKHLEHLDRMKELQR